MMMQSSEWQTLEGEPAYERRRRRSLSVSVGNLEQEGLEAPLECRAFVKLLLLSASVLPVYLLTYFAVKLCCLAIKTICE